jgi:SAM-dependent methyltransferase
VSEAGIDNLTSRSCSPGHPPDPEPADVIWHDIECGGYEADLSFWERIADPLEGPILDLGCGSGRVSLHLARRGNQMHGLDTAAELVAALNRRADSAKLPATATVGDARAFAIEEEFALAIAPMQLIQLLCGPAERIACLRCVAKHLRSGSTLAVAIVDGFPAELTEEAPPPLPDVREVDGWLYSSLPLDAGLEVGSIVVRRLRQLVSPEGQLSDALDEIPLRVLSAETLELEATEAGLGLGGRHLIPPTETHVGSTVVLLEAP